MKKVSIIIPCYNEEKGIGNVIKHIPYKKIKKLGYKTEVLVVDNNSKDKTARVAMDHGAFVCYESKQGKGNAIRTGFRWISDDTKYVVMLDGDNTYKAKEIPRLLEPLMSNFCDVIIGSRLEGKIRGSALSFSHRLANWFFTFFVRYFYLTNTSDTCTGFFAWKRNVVENLFHYTNSPGFAIETEMITKMAKLGYRMYSVPITYDARAGESKISPLKDGLRITWMLIKNLVWRPDSKTKSILADKRPFQVAYSENTSE